MITFFWRPLVKSGQFCIDEVLRRKKIVITIITKVNWRRVPIEVRQSLSCRGIALDTSRSHQFDHKVLIKFSGLRDGNLPQLLQNGPIHYSDKRVFWPKIWKTVFSDSSWIISCTDIGLRTTKWFLDQLYRALVLFLWTSCQSVTLPLTANRSLTVRPTWKVTRGL